MDILLLGMYDVLADNKLLERPTALLAKDYVKATSFPFGLCYEPPFGPGPRKRIISKKEERKIVEKLAKDHGLTYLQTRRRINQAIFKAASYSIHFNQLNEKYNLWGPDAPPITPFMIQEYLKENSETPEIDFKVMTEFLKKMRSSSDAYIV